MLSTPLTPLLLLLSGLNGPAGGGQRERQDAAGLPGSGGPADPVPGTADQTKQNPLHLPAALALPGEGAAGALGPGTVARHRQSGPVRARRSAANNAWVTQGLRGGLQVQLLCLSGHERGLLAPAAQC